MTRFRATLLLLLLLSTAVLAQGPFTGQIAAALQAIGYVLSTPTMVQWSKHSLYAANTYLNFGVTQGASGYGIRDSAGVIQVKSSGGSWLSLATVLGNVVGPGSANDNCVARFDGPTGLLLQNSLFCVDDSGYITTTGAYNNGQFRILGPIGSTADTGLIISPTGTAYTANRTLSLNLLNAARTLTLSGDVTLGDWFDQSVKTTASPTFAALGVASANPLYYLTETDMGADLRIWALSANDQHFALSRVNDALSDYDPLVLTSRAGLWTFQDPATAAAVATLATSTRTLTLSTGAWGTGSAVGPHSLIGSNSSGSGAAGVLGLADKGNTFGYLWNADTANRLQWGTAPPQEDGSPSDTSGTYVALLSDTLGAFAATTSAALFAVLSDETGGTGVAVGNISPQIATPLFISFAGVVGIGPVMYFNESDAATDEKLWQFSTASGDFRLQTLTDASAIIATRWVMTRAGLTTLTGTSFNVVQDGASGQALNVTHNAILQMAMDTTQHILFVASGAHGAGNVGGMGLSAGRNTTGAGAAGFLRLVDRGGTPIYLWSDDNNYPRFALNPPEEDDSPHDITGGGAIQWAGKGVPIINSGAATFLAGRDLSGRITATATGAMTAVLDLSTTYPVAPNGCTATNETTANVMRAVASTSQLTITGTTVTGDVIGWRCGVY